MNYIDDSTAEQRRVELPPELRDTPQWVAWQREMRRDKNTGELQPKPTKVPYGARSGCKASSTNPATWALYEQAEAAARTGVYAGVGFMFSASDDYAGIDIDHCVDGDTGEIKPWARVIVDYIASYTELSPSGTGLHIFIKGKMPGKGHHKGCFEAYDSKRFFTVTGQHVAGTPRTVERRQVELERYLRETEADASALAKIAKAREARDELKLLWLGDEKTIAERDKEGQSASDMAFCGMIAPFTDGTTEQIERIFRHSGLYRPKWDELRGEKTYGQITAGKAATPQGVSPDGDRWRVNADPASPDFGMCLGDDTRPVLRAALEATKVLTDGTGEPCGAYVRITRANGHVATVYLPAVVVSARYAPDALRECDAGNWLADAARVIQQWLDFTLHHEGITPREQGLARPCWHDGQLRVPGPGVPLIPGSDGAALAGYGETAGDEEAAQGAWRGVVAAGLANPKLLVTIGGAFGSPYLEPLGCEAGILAAVGQSRGGKTQSVLIAAATMGRPDVLLSTFNATATALTARIAALNILPAFVDEMAASGAREGYYEQLIFSVAAGRGRQRANRSGALRASPHWRSNLITNGERGLASASGLAGTRARVVEVQAPMTPDAATIDRVAELATAHYGWPLRWLAASPALAQAKADYAEATATLTATVAHPIARTLAGRMAASVTGFMALARLCEAGVTLASVIEGAAVVLKQCAEALDDEGPSIADRLLDAVFEYEASHGTDYGPEAKFVSMTDDGSPALRSAGGAVWGFKLGDRLGVFPAALTCIARDAGIADPTPALRALRDRGVLIAGSEGKRLSRVQRVPGSDKPQRLYVFRRAAAEAEHEAA